jgi:adenylate kinase
MIVILLGPPGVGKGTQGARLCDDRGLTHLSTGDLLRKARREGTPLGQEAQGYMDRGELVPDSVIMGMVREALEQLAEDGGVIFDGFPRTVPQAEGLDEVLSDLGRQVDRVVLLEADDDVLVKRLSGRRTCSQCGAVYNVHFDPPRQEGVCDRCETDSLEQRVDDQADTVRNRLEVYRRQTEPLVDFYGGRYNLLRRVNGDQDLEAVRAALAAALD